MIDVLLGDCRPVNNSVTGRPETQKVPPEERVNGRIGRIGERSADPSLSRPFVSPCLSPRLSHASDFYQLSPRLTFPFPRLITASPLALDNVVPSLSALSSHRVIAFFSLYKFLIRAGGFCAPFRSPLAGVYGEGGGGGRGGEG